MRRRAAETLVEVVTAMTLFGVLLGGIFDFMGGQSHYIGRLGYHSRIMYGLQKYVNTRPLGAASWNNSQDNSLGVEFLYKENVITEHSRYVNSVDVTQYVKLIIKDGGTTTEKRKITTTTKIKYTTKTDSKNLLARTTTDYASATEGTFSFVLKDEGSTTTSKIESVTSKDEKDNR